MVLWGLIELTISTVGAYNIIKGLYGIYTDAEKVKEKYKSHKHIKEEYLRDQGLIEKNRMTESQYTKLEDEFLLIKDN